jgi:hypothetical protein
MPIYNVDECCVFKKTKEKYGGLSNMAGGFPLMVNGISILTSEALYQACRYPHLPDIQKEIIDQKSPMGAKMKSKPHRRNRSRADWNNVQIDIMRWCLRVKLAQHILSFGTTLSETEKNIIVERSHNDNFWGAVKNKDNNNILEGQNNLGNLLMDLRTYYYQHKGSEILTVIEPLNIPDFLLYGRPIEIVINNSIPL